MNKIFIIFTLFTLNVFGSSFIASLAQDAYLEPIEFKTKYKTEHTKVGSSIIHDVQFHALETKDIVYITFRGTQSKRNVKTDLNIRHVQFLDIPNSKVHAGFYNIATKSKQVLASLFNKNKKLIITGHSLGGGVGLLLGALLYYDNKNVEVFSYGAPPVGNNEFVDSIKNLNHYRHIHNKDIIPKINKPIAEKIKKFFISKSKFKITKLYKLPFSFVFKFAVNYLINIPYDFMHHGKKVELFNTPITTYTSNSKINFAKKFVLFDDAHSILTYVDGVKSLR